MPLDIGSIKSASRSGEDTFVFTLQNALNDYRLAKYRGIEDMRIAVDTIEDFMAYYRVIQNNQVKYDDHKNKLFNEYQRKHNLFNPKKTTLKQYELLEYWYLRQKFMLLMELIGHSSLLPAVDIAEDQE